MPAQVGTLGVSVVIALTGVASIGSVGSVGNNQSVAISGTSVTTAVGNVSVSAEQIVALTGVSSTSAVGNLGFTKSGSLPLTGVSGASAVDSVGITKSGSLPITGVLSTSAVGNVLFVAGSEVALTGVDLTSAVGNLGFTKDGTLALTGVESLVQVGSTTVEAAPVIPVATPTTSFSGRIALDLARPGDIEDPATNIAIEFLHDAVELLSQDVGTLLSNLDDVGITAPLVENQVLHYDETIEKWKNKLIDHTHNLYGIDANNVNQHTDIDISTTLVTGSVLTYVTNADGGSNQFVPVPTFISMGYGGIEQTGTPALANLGAGFVLVPANAGLLTTPSSITQDQANDGIRINTAGVWNLDIAIHLSHNENASGRSFDVQVYNTTESTEIKSLSVPIARNQPATIISLNFMVDIPVSTEGDLIQVRLGNGSTVTSVVLRAYQFSANRISGYVG